MELEQQLRAALAPCSSGSAVRAAVLARLSEAPKQGGARLRRPTIVGGLVALAAAAGMLAAYFHNGRAPIAPSHGSELSSAPSPAASPVAEMTSAAAETVATLPAQKADAMPRLLPPDYSAQETAIDAALQQAADIHPELVEGPEADGLFAATLLIRADRSLVHSVVRMIPAKDLHTPQDLHVDELAVPFEANQFPGYRKKGAVLPDGRSLRAETSLQLGVVTDSYDFTRSVNLVHAIVRRQHADLVLPASGADIALITVFMAEDGSIQRESVDLDAQLEPLPFAGPADNTDQTGRVAQYLAQEVARRLALEVEQIGLVGASHIEWPRAAASTAPSRSESSETKRFGLHIIYAWPRRAGESAPVYGQFGPRGKARATLEPHFDEAAALAILKREIPDAFLVDTDVAGTLGVFLTHQGELIRAARLPAPRDGVNDDFNFLQQLAPGVKMGDNTRWNIKDETGTNAHIVFAWAEKPAAASLTAP